MRHRLLVVCMIIMVCPALVLAQTRTPVSGSRAKAKATKKRPTPSSEPINIGEDDTRENELANMRKQKKDLLARGQELVDQSRKSVDSPEYAREFVKYVEDLGLAITSPRWKETEAVELPKPPEPSAKALEALKRSMANEERQRALEEPTPEPSQKTPASDAAFAPLETKRMDALIKRDGDSKSTPRPLKYDPLQPTPPGAQMQAPGAGIFVPQPETPTPTPEQ